MRYFTWTLMATVAGVLFVGSCNDNPSDDGPVASEQEAYAALETALYGAFTSGINSSSDLNNSGMANVNILFRKRAAENPGDATANFGAGLTEVFASYADPDISQMIKDMEGAGQSAPGTRLFPFRLPKGPADLGVRAEPLAAGLATILSRAVTDPPSLARIQNVLRTKFIPRLEYALARFAVVEQNAGFEFRISGKMQGNTSLPPMYLDLTEVYIIEAMVRMLKASVDQFLVFDFQLPDYTARSVVAGMQPSNTTFFYLAVDGRTRAQGIKSNLLATFLTLRHAVDFLAAETDNQSDDIIKLGPGGAMSPDIQQFRDALSSAETLLTRPQVTRLIDGDTDGNDYDLTINLSAFYDNPPQNPKTQWLPAYTVDSSAFGQILWHWTQTDYASFTFPDPTFSGVLPGMTNATLKRIMHIDEAFGWRLECSLYDQNGTMSEATTLKLDVNGTLVDTKYYKYGYSSPYNRYGWFLITSGNGSPATVRVYQGATEVPLAFNTLPVVRLKNYDYMQIDMTQASQTMTANAYAGNPPYVMLSPNAWGYYIVERRTTGSFAAIDTANFYQYYDYTVTSSNTYQYRLRMSPSPYSWGFAAARAQNYTNTVTVPVP